MPRLSKLLIRAALIHMGIGFFIGSLLLWNKGLPFAPAIWRLRASHIELLIFGWTIQFVMGVSFWVIPRFSTGNRYGKEVFGWISFVLLNMGVVTTAIVLWWGKAPRFGIWRTVSRILCSACLCAPDVVACQTLRYRIDILFYFYNESI
ncbi:MAG: hypothetical protein Q9P01_05585 [Anaerolineae bacterium]|nr:hypothetical protein [Anaerolineae bacterium]